MVPGILIYLDDIKDAEGIPDEDIGKLIRALVVFAESGEDSPLPASVTYPYRAMKRKIIANEQKYAEVSEKRRRAIQARWNRQNQQDTNNTNVSGCIQENTSGQFVNQNKTEKETKKEKEKEDVYIRHNNYISSSNRPTEAGKAESKTARKDPPKFFEEFWQVYPKRQGRGDAEKAFAKQHVDSTLLHKMLDAIGRALESRQWQEDGGKYIPNPSTWLNQRRWEDDPEVRVPAYNPQKTRTVSAQAYTQRAYTEAQLSGASNDIMLEAQNETDD